MEPDEPGPLRATMSRPPKLQILREAFSCTHCIYLVISLTLKLTISVIRDLGQSEKNIGHMVLGSWRSKRVRWGKGGGDYGRQRARKGEECLSNCMCLCT